ncbi:SEC12-like protein 1 [Miscanthus floridulus]|uniref:SEC12-like protein 1 n=1 Tax=Miscanthus floridulus TaxID=154761 RepID=UPI00345A8064
MAGGGGGGEASAAGGGKVACAAWIRRREEKAAAARVFAAYGRAAGAAGSPPALEVLGFDAKECSLSPEPLARAVLGEGGAGDAPRGIAVHPAGDELVCATATGCRLFKLIFEEFTVRIIPRDAPPLESVGPQKCLAFSTDGAKFAIGGEDGHLRIFHWPSMNVLLDEPKAHKSFRDMDISLDSEFLVSTSTDGSARIWKIDEGAPLVNLTRSSDEKIECCRFSRDGMKPFLFCTVAKGSKVVTVVWNISDWKRIGYKRLLGKAISTLSVSLDGKYLALGSHDGDFCAVDVKKMEVSHWSKKVHLGSPVTSIEFCPTERVVISTSHQWGAELTKLNVPADWKEWQVWLVLLALFLASAILFYVFYERSDTFWNFPMGRHQPAKPWNVLKESPPVPEDQNPW